MTELKLVKGRGETAIETIEALVMLVATYYMLDPGKLEQHAAYLRKIRDRAWHWISVQNTLANIRNLPETDNSCHM